MTAAGWNSLEIANEVNFANNAHKAVALLTTFCVFRLLEEERDGAAQRKAEGKTEGGGGGGGGSRSSWLALMREELLAVTASSGGGGGGGGGDGVGRASPGPMRSDTPRLPVTMAVWKETLRLHPAALAVFRQTGAPVEVSTARPPPSCHGGGGGDGDGDGDGVGDGDGDGDGDGTAAAAAAAAGVRVTVPADREIILLVYAMHTAADYWTEPHRFKPGRWLPAAHPCGRGCHGADGGDLSPRSPLSDRGVKGAFVPFLDGQRQCQGRMLAELEFMVMMHALLTRFELRLAQPDFSLTLNPDMYPTLAEPIRILATPLQQPAGQPGERKKDR